MKSYRKLRSKKNKTKNKRNKKSKVRGGGSFQLEKRCPYCKEYKLMECPVGDVICICPTCGTKV